MSYPYYILAKGNLVRKFPSYGRMSRGSLVITSARWSRRSSCMAAAESNSSVIGCVPPSRRCWATVSNTKSRPWLTLWSSQTHSQAQRVWSSLGPGWHWATVSVNELVVRSFFLAFFLSFFLSCSFFLPSCLHCLTYWFNHAFIRYFITSWILLHSFIYFLSFHFSAFDFSSVQFSPVSFFSFPVISFQVISL